MEMNDKLKLIVFGLLIVLLLSGCQGAPSKDEGVTVYTSIYPLYETANKVAGDNITVKLVVPNGAELHSYRPTPKQIAKLERSALFFYNGVGLEPWASDVKENLTDSKSKMINISRYVNLIDYNKNNIAHSSNEHESNADSHNHDHKHQGQHDPHLWLNPLNMKRIAQKMKVEFSELDPENQKDYQKNYEEFAKKINKLDQKYQSILNNKTQDHILVSHSAFGYLGHRYGFEQLSVTGVAPHEEPSPGVLARLTTYAREHNLEYIFMETLASPKTVNVLAEEANLQVLELNPVAGLTKEEKESGEDYFTLMYQNLENLKKALVEENE